MVNMAQWVEINLWFNGFVFHVFVSKDYMSANTEAQSTRSFRFLHERPSRGQDDGVRGTAEIMAA